MKEKAKLIEGNSATKLIAYSYRGHRIEGRSPASSYNPYQRGRVWSIPTLGGWARNLVDAKARIDAALNS